MVVNYPEKNDKTLFLTYISSKFGRLGNYKTRKRHPKTAFADSKISPIIQIKTPETNLQSHALSRTYSAILPTSLTYIVLSARGCSPWRPAAVMSTTRCETNIFPLDFQGSLVTSRTPQKAGCFSSCQALSPDDPIPRLSKSVKKKRELFPGLRVTSRGSLALPHLRNISYC